MIKFVKSRENWVVINITLLKGIWTPRDFFFKLTPRDLVGVILHIERNKSVGWEKSLWHATEKNRGVKKFFYRHITYLYNLMEK